ncbi:hypothetical protein DAEQUDRAFT_733668 [Daedalea quercina L-15889]|uniref:DUF6534 domain-containing protein n=1 Tax=Daedalea quercina L-15889 TaxID=1314783 RepID=A0A165KTY5_9APHY|nr:hypothetical protein DAEQUDRAFT_733668 [Daedalea quercina L-15889]
MSGSTNTSATDCVDPLSIIQLTGPVLLAFQFNWGLLGIFVVQVYNYYQASFRDGFVIKGLVYGLLLFELTQTALATHDAYCQFALSFGNYEGFMQTYFLWLDAPVFVGVSSGAIQCFYAWRIYILSRSKLLFMGIVLVSLMQFSAAIAEGVLSDLLRDQAEEQTKTPSTTTVWLAGTASCDVIIACTMIYYLWSNRTGYKNTNKIINRLIRVIVETGMATAILAILDLVFFLHFKHNYYHLVCALLLSKLYSNSLLVLLNNRVALRAHVQADNSFALGSMRFGGGTTGGGMVSGTEGGLGGVHVNTNSHTFVDHVAVVTLRSQAETQSSGLDYSRESPTNDIKVAAQESFAQ